jgi:adenylate cyclase
MPGEIVLAPRHHLEKIPTYALIDVLKCSKAAPEVLKQVFRNRIVLIGSTLPEEDRKISSGRFLTPQRHDGTVLHPCGLRRLAASVPESPTVPGVYLFAEAVDAVVTGRVTAIVGRGLVAGLTAVTAVAGAVAGLFLTPWLTFAVITASVLLIFTAATGLLSADIWLLVALPLVALVAAPVVAYVVLYLVEERARRQIQNAFSHYLSPTIVVRLASEPSALKLGGELREVTVMFADLSGFTALSGKVEPEVLTRMVNQYLSYVVEAVEATGGYVDKFIGDAVMAIWGAPVGDPSHAANAIRAAMAAAARIHQEKRSAEARGEKSFSVKIGLNSGAAVVGNVGTEKRYNYTAVGETVNVAARLEGVPTIYGCHIVVGPRTAELAKDEFLMRELDWIQVKGREAPVAVFEPLVERDKASQKQIHCAQGYAEALEHYRAMRFAEACAIWETLAEEETASSPDGKGEQLLNPPSIMAQRARAFEAKPPARPWDRVWVLTGK